MKQKFFSSVFLSFAAFGCAHTQHKAEAPPPEVYDVSRGEPVQISAKKVDLPVYIFGEGEGSQGGYVPSGYMGDSGSLKMLSTDTSAPVIGGKQGTGALKISYEPKGSAGWAGVYWLSPANNWAKIKGAGYDLTGSPRLTFWAKGEKGGERLSEIKIGGIVGPYPDTDTASLQGLKLTEEWKKYEVELTGKDLRHIVGGFMFALRRSDNPRGALFYMDEIQFEGPSDGTADFVNGEAIAESEESASGNVDETRNAAVGGPASAEGRTAVNGRSWQIGLHPGYAFLSGEYSDELDNSPAIQATVARSTRRWGTLGLEIGHGFDHGHDGFDHQDGLRYETEAKLNWIQVTPYVRMDLTKRRLPVTPYAVLGVGAYHLTQDQDGPLQTNDPSITVEFLSLSSTFLGANGGFGFEKAIGRQFIAGVDVRYHRIFAIEDDYKFILPSLRLSYVYPSNPSEND